VVAAAAAAAKAAAGSLQDAHHFKNNGVEDAFLRLQPAFVSEMVRD
jgi:hypothetical protein